MPDGLAGILHEASVLYRFADFIGEYCRQQKRSQTYVGSAAVFFKYIEDLTAGMQEATDRAIRSNTRLSTYARNMRTFRGYLRLLHTLIKPASDAHTLTIPAPLIDLASAALQRIDGMSGSRLLILLTPDFMYYQRSHTDIKSQAQDIQSFIPRAAFPRKLGFIEIPYSQGPSFFNNLAIYHEIGHFVYEELSNRAPSGKLYENLVSVQDRCLNRLFNVRKDDTSRVESKRQALAVAARVLENWTQEIFCDLFALRLLGPAFSFMLIEMMGMLGLSQAECEKFDPDHPALAYRFSEHKNQLQDDFWWTRIAGLRAEQKRRLEELAAMPRRHYKFFVDGKNRGPEKLMNAFIDDVVPAIRKLARHVTRRAVPVVRRFDRAQAHIQSCLRAGIVPLTDTRDRRDPVSIINAAFWFYLTSIPEVIKEFESPKDENSVAVHSKWKERVEMWAMKAIEDSQIMTRYKGSISRGPI